jgi:alpha-beta hydrolase superfamily lysophospholipase
MRVRGLGVGAIAARGVATLRVDKRGMYASAVAAKDANAVTIADYGDDVQSWANVLRNEAHAPCVWVLGHSEGGLAALAAAKNLQGACGFARQPRPLAERESRAQERDLG